MKESSTKASVVKEKIELDTWPSQAPGNAANNETRVSEVAVVGAGMMGRGIARTCAARGIFVTLFEVEGEPLARGMAQLSSEMDQEIERWGMTKSEKRAILARIKGAAHHLEAARAQIVIEAITEDFEKKKALFQQLDDVCPPASIFVTNTSSLSITELAATTRREDRFIGLHFLNPVPKIPLVEIVRGLKTSDDTFHQVQNFACLLDKTPVEVFEYPGYITTRIIVTMLNEAMYVLMEGVATAESIDTAMKLGFNLSIGPLALADQIGLDEVMRWMNILHDELGDMKYRPCPLLRKMVRAGNLGKKAGRGFFYYDKNGRRLATPGKEGSAGESR